MTVEEGLDRKKIEALLKVCGWRWYLVLIYCVRDLFV
jgi:hypothetical protein